MRINPNTGEPLQPGENPENPDDPPTSDTNPGYSFQATPPSKDTVNSWLIIGGVILFIITLPAQILFGS